MINAKLPAPSVPVRGKWAPVQDEQQAGQPDEGQPQEETKDKPSE